MKKTYNQAQLAELAAERFKTLGVNKLYATSDGSFFILENRAHLHAGPKGNVFTLVNEDAPKSGEQPVSIKELKARVKNTSDLQELTGMMLHEVSAENRKEAVQIIQSRIDALTQSGKDNKAAEAERKAVLQELTRHGLDFDPEADTESLKSVLAEFLAMTKVEPLDLSGNAKEVAALVSACDNVAVLQETVNAETSGARRKSVLAALNARIEELSKNA